MPHGTQDFTPDPHNDAILINVGGTLTARADAIKPLFGGLQAAAASAARRRN